MLDLFSVAISISEYLIELKRGQQRHRASSVRHIIPLAIIHETVSLWWVWYSALRFLWLSHSRPC